MRTAVAVLLSFLCPGLGQLYNRESRKGWLIILSSTFLFLAPAVFLVWKVTPLLPDPAKGPFTQEMVRGAVLQALGSQRHLLSWASFLFLGIWAYSITQAYFRARELADISKTKGGPAE